MPPFHFKKFLKCLSVLSLSAVIFAFILYNFIPSELFTASKAFAEAIGDGVLIYDEGSPTTNVQLRTWVEGTATLSGETSPFAGTGVSKFVTVKSSPTREEMLLGIQDSAGTLTIYKSADNGGSWSSEWSVLVGDGNLRRFGIGYEQLSGNAIVVYSGNTGTDGQELKYYTWNGASWIGPTNLGAARTSAVIYGLEVVERPNSNEVGLVWVDTAFDLSANVWTGSAWYGEPSSALSSDLSRITTGSVPSSRAFDLTFETLSGDLMVAWGNDAVQDLFYIIKTAGGVWNTAQQVLSPEEATMIDLESSPISDKIGYANRTDNGGDCDFAVWSGSAWGAFGNDTSCGVVDNGNLNVNTTWLIDGSNEVAIFPYRDSPADAAINWYKSDNGATPTQQASSTVSPVVAGVERFIFSQTSSNDTKQALVFFEDNSSDIYVKKASLSGTTVTWTSVEPGGVVIEGDASVIGFNLLGFAYVRFVGGVAPLTLLGNATSSEASSVAIAPGAAATDLDVFDLQTTSGSDSVTAITVALSPGSAGALSQANITNTSNVSQCTAINNPVSDTLSFTGCGISINTTVTNYKVRITPKTHANMPPPSGSSYSVTGTVTGFTSSNAQAGSDAGSANITIDNLSPGEASGAAASPGDATITVSWTNPADADFSQVVILRKAGSSIADKPTEGATYAPGNTIGASTVFYVGTVSPQTNSGLTNGTTYYYRIFAKDGSGNYSSLGTEVSGVPEAAPPPPPPSNASGTLTSSIYATSYYSVEGAALNSIMWQGTPGLLSTVRFRIASSNCPNGNSNYPVCNSGSWTYLGPDGTSLSYYFPAGPDIPVEIKSTDHNNKRYFRYKIFLDIQNGGTTPVVQDVIISWSP